MTKIKILIPTDFSVESEYAYLMVRNLSKHINCEVHFVHIMPIPDSVSVDAEGNLTTCGEISVSYLQQQQQIALRRLKELQENYADVQVHLSYGKIVDATLDFAVKGKYDLIVQGTKGASGIKELISGSLTQFIVRRSPIPVLTVMCDRSELEIKDLLVVLDFARAHNYELPLLKTLSSAYGSEVHLLHVTGSGTDEEVAVAHMTAFARLNGLTTYHTHFVKERDIERGVTVFQQDHNVDLVYIEHAMWHNKPDASERLVNHMFKPVMVVNPPTG